MMKCGMTILLAATLLCAALPARAGGVEYPLIGNIELEEGTLEIWFVPMADDLYPKKKEGEFRSAFRLFHVAVPEDFVMTCAWSNKGSGLDEQHGLTNSISPAGGDRKSLLPVHAAPKGWRKGAAAYAAFAWKGKRMWMYADRPWAARAQARAFGGLPAGGRIVIGDRDGHDTPIIVQAVRISSIARDAEGPLPALPQPDIFTLLLDRFDGAPGPAAGGSRAEVIAGLTQEQGGAFRGVCRRVAAPVAGLALYTARDIAPEGQR
jgi:hypothetical protein